MTAKALMSTTATAITIARGCGPCSKHIHVKGFARAVSPPDGAWLARGWLTGRAWWAGDWGVHGDRRTVGQAPCPCSRNPDFTGLDLYLSYVISLLACRRRRVVNAPHSSRAGPQRLAVLATLHPTAGEPSWGVAPGWTRALALRYRRASHRTCSIAGYVSRRTQILHIPKTPDGKSLDLRISAVKSGGHGRLGSSGALGAGESELTYKAPYDSQINRIQQKFAGIKHLK